MRRIRVLVTGAGRAIGAATCRELTAAGHTVIATARDESLLQDLDVTIRLTLDVTREDSLQRAVERAGDLEAIVNNAALQGTAPSRRTRSRSNAICLRPILLVLCAWSNWS